MAAVAGGFVENHVPRYDIFGHQHHREPFVDKSRLLEEDIRHPRWLDPPPDVRSRAELLQARQAARKPDASYDFDGDGAVGQLDYFIGRSFDQDADGRLTKAERLRAQGALERGFLDRHVRGLDSAGPFKASALQQRRGVILTGENPSDIGLTYGPHHNADQVPPNATRTALALSRAAELKAAGAAVGERYAAQCAPVTEPAPPDHRSQERTCPIDHIGQRAEADHQASRIRGGLLPSSAPVNPEREVKEVGLQYVEQPLCATRTQILETRKEGTRQELEEQRVRGESAFVDSGVKRTMRAVKAFEFRRPDHVPMTLTQLQVKRRQAKVEHDMEHFANPRVGPREYPRFSDDPEVPFWLAGEASRGRASTAPPGPRMSRVVSEPTFKITEEPFNHASARPAVADLPDASHRVAAAGLAASTAPSQLGSKTVKRWTADLLDRGAGRNRPRLFDAVPLATIGPKELEPLGLTSSLEPVRREAQRQVAADRRDPRLMRSRLEDEVFQQSLQTSKLRRASNASAEISLARRSSVAGGVSKSLRFQGDALGSVSMPRLFGSTADLSRPLAETGVRTGGFSGAFQQLVESS